MFWPTKKKVPQKIKSEKDFLQESKEPIWQNKYLLEIETEVYTPDLRRKDWIRNPSDTKTTLLYEYTIALYKQTYNKYLLLVDRVYKNKKDGSGLSVIEELSQVIGRHANGVIYQIDATQSVPVTIYNYKDLLRLWQEDKKIIEEYYTGRPAQVLMTLTDQKITDQNGYTQLLHKAFPNGILVDTFCAYYQPTTTPFMISSHVLPNGHVTVPLEIKTKSKEEFRYTAHNKTLLGIDAVKDIFAVKQDLIDQQYGLETSLQCNMTLQPDNQSWHQADWILDIDCQDVYHKHIHLKLTRC